MHTHLRSFFILLFWGSALLLKAQNPAPVNDTVRDAINLGLLPAPGPCSTNSYGDTVHVFGTTQFASYNSLDFSPIHCFPNGSPDVWYKFRPTGRYLEIVLYGYNGLDTSFVKLYQSQGNFLQLIPLECAVSNAGIIYVSIQTFNVYGEYYLQVGGSNMNMTGDFDLYLKSYDICSECIKEAEMEMFPVPTHGRYNLSDTVTMCVNVKRFDMISTSFLHGIVPSFGSAWNLNSLVPVLAPNSPNVPTGWNWYTNLNTPSGTLTGYFYDADLNGNPTDNSGDSGQVLTNWKACWKIATLPLCNSYDLDVSVSMKSDIETGIGNSNLACENAAPLIMQIASLCCKAPTVIIDSATSCLTGSNIYVQGNGNLGDIYNYNLLDGNGSVIQFISATTTGMYFNLVQPGTYTIRVDNLTQGCSSYETVNVVGGITLSLQQTVIACQNGLAWAVANVSGGVAPYVYTWINVPTSNQNDSVVFNVSNGMIYVIVQDATGCMAFDSLLIVSDPSPQVIFDYGPAPQCSNFQDTISVLSLPGTSGGTYFLVAPTASNITVNPNNGDVLLNGTSIAPPYDIIIKYAVSGNCPAVFYDTIHIVAQPSPPSPLGNNIITYCLGNPPPVLSIIPQSNLIPVWYDNQLGSFSVGTSYTTPLNASSAPGTYIYYVSNVVSINGGCTSNPTTFIVNVLASPQIFATATPAVCPGDTVILTASGCLNCSYQWSPAPSIGPSNTSVTTTTVTSTTVYTVSASEQNGCYTTDSVTVTVLPAILCGSTSETFHVYSGFSPNGDGINETWIIDGITNLTNPKVNIYNRWGMLVWEGADYNNNTVVWNGKDMDGNLLPSGTYYYIISSIEKREKGWVELSR